MFEHSFDISHFLKCIYLKKHHCPYQVFISPEHLNEAPLSAEPRKTAVQCTVKRANTPVLLRLLVKADCSTTSWRDIGKSSHNDDSSTLRVHDWFQHFLGLPSCFFLFGRLFGHALVFQQNLPTRLQFYGSLADLG